MNNKQKVLMTLQNSIGNTKKAMEIWNALDDEFQADMDIREVYFTALAHILQSDKVLMAGIIDSKEETLEESNAFLVSIQKRSK